MCEGNQPFVILESPYAGLVAKKTIANFNYAKAILNDSVSRGEVPFLSHLFYTQFLNDKHREDRELGMSLGFAVMRKADLVAVYLDLGWSDGMVDGVIMAEKLGLKWEKRRIGWPFQKEPRRG